MIWGLGSGSGSSVGVDCVKRSLRLSLRPWLRPSSVTLQRNPDMLLRERLGRGENVRMTSLNGARHYI